MPPRRARFGKPKRLKLRGGGIALTALLVSVLALTFSAGAQNGGLPSGNTNTYEDPQPCGPGAGNAFMPEPHEITEGHFALFDAYWADTTATGSTEGNSGVLHTNTCPPEVTTTTGEDEEGEETTVKTLTDSTLDIDEAIFHVLEKHKVDVVATNAEITDGQLSLQEYPALTGFVDAGDTVWWLRLDDPDTSKDDASDLTLGFSTRLLVGDQKWHVAGGRDPLSYQLEVERYPSHTTGLPHFFAYRAPQSGNATQTPVWSSATAGTSALPMPLGKQIEDLQWIFTDEGTYEIWVELVGHVRQYEDPKEAPDGWEAISPNVTETSEVKRYVIQVGDFEEEEPPLFGLNLSVPENSPAGTVVSPPLPILEAEADKLYYALSGDGYKDFALETATNPHTVQIVVAEGADLDYETTPEYELRLNVTDKLDHQSNPDPTIDDVLGIIIALEDDLGSAILDVSNRNPAAGETVTFTATVTEGFGDGHTLNYAFESKGRQGVGTATPTTTLSHPGRFVDVVTVTVSYHKVEGDVTSESVSVVSAPVTVTWSAP